MQLTRCKTIRIGSAQRVPRHARISSFRQRNFNRPPASSSNRGRLQRCRAQSGDEGGDDWDEWDEWGADAPSPSEQQGAEEQQEGGAPGAGEGAAEHASSMRRTSAAYERQQRPLSVAVQPVCLMPLGAGVRGVVWRGSRCLTHLRHASPIYGMPNPSFWANALEK
jgi:hypothetical protein